MRTSSALLSAAALLAAAPALAQAPLKTLTKPDAEYSEPFTQINGVRELRDGRVIVSDLREKTVQLVDLKANSAQRIGREGSGPGEYGLPSRLLALPGDTSVVYDPLNRRFLVINPDGKAGTFYSMEDGSADGPPRFGLGARYTDARGRLYVQGTTFRLDREGAPSQSDTAPIVRYDRASKKADTVAWVYAPTTTVRGSAGGGAQRVMVRVGGGNPFTGVDDWAVMPDGRVAVVRTKGYRVDWYLPNGQKTSGPAIAYQPIKVTEEDKKLWREQQQRATPLVITNQTGPGGTTRSAGVAPPTSANLPDPTDWPDVKPAFTANAAAAAPNGMLWVLRTRHATDKVPSYDVIDASGRVVQRVALPVNTRLVGFGNGTVYLARNDEDDLQYLQRYRMP